MGFMALDDQLHLSPFFPDQNQQKSTSAGWTEEILAIGAPTKERDLRSKFKQLNPLLNLYQTWLLCRASIIASIISPSL